MNMSFDRRRKSLYRDRIEAGRRLAADLGAYAGPGTLVLALPRGGVPVGLEIARALGASLDVLLVRKLGFPGRAEVAAGAIASGGVRVLNPEVAVLLDPRHLDRVEERERQELARRERAYRGDRPPPSLAERTVILVDDGMATGATMRAAVKAARAMRARTIVVAVPVAPPDRLEALHRAADAVVCPYAPTPFGALSLWYEEFPQLADETVRELLMRAWGDPAAGPAEVSCAGGSTS